MKADNLELATYQQHNKAVLGKKYKLNDMAKLKAEHILAIRERRAAGEKLKTIAADFGTTGKNISRICLGRRWAFTG